EAAGVCRQTLPRPSFPPLRSAAKKWQVDEAVFLGAAVDGKLSCGFGCGVKFLHDGVIASSQPLAVEQIHKAESVQSNLIFQSVVAHPPQLIARRDAEHHRAVT